MPPLVTNAAILTSTCNGVLSATHPECVASDSTDAFLRPFALRHFLPRRSLAHHCLSATPPHFVPLTAQTSKQRLEGRLTNGWCYETTPPSSE